MKKISFLALAAGFCISAASPAFANRNLWTGYEGKIAPSQNPKQFLPANYIVVQLNQEGIKQLLAGAGTSFDKGVDLSLPTPDGGFKNYRVWNTPVLESEIQAEFQEIQTYTGTLLEDVSQTVKLTTGPMGLFVRTFSFNMEDVFAIEPYGYDANGYYTVAAAKDFHRLALTGCNPSKVGGSSLTGEDPIVINPSREKIAERTMGNTRRTYRMAVACTGDYALAVSGTPNPTVSQILNIITATINNANGIWEREVSISATIVNNNTAVIYLDPTTDPYVDDGDHGTVIDENQANHDIFIGNGNYDLGHVFTASGGGLAMLGSVCAPGGKASGVSGSSGPTDIGTVCHEVGHQMGAGHTFSSEQGGCDGNIMLESAYEPGSGTTIMSYNGACGSDNTPIFTTPMTDYYNQFNLGQMRAVITTSGACGTTALGQNPVSMADLDLRYIIPNNTPFELIAPEATNTVATNSAPGYTWEQFDKADEGMTEASGANATVGPVFMSMPPINNRYRVFPQYATLAAGNYTASGERLPNVNRNMHFKATARSIAQDGWGTHNTIDGNLTIKVAASGMGLFRVTGPSNPALSLDPGQPFTVEWSIGNTQNPVDSIMTGFVNIYLSIDGGLSFPIILATNVPNNGSYNATTPNYLSTDARVKVKAVGNIYFDVSKVGFKTNGVLSVKGVDVSGLVNVFPNPATSEVNIKNQAYNGDKMEVVMLNVLGQQVWKGNLEKEATINVASFAKGAYYLHFKTEKSGKYGVQKLIVQ